MVQILMPDIGKILNENECIKILACMCDTTTDKINLKSVNTVAGIKSMHRYFTQNGDEIADENKAYYKWVSTGYYSRSGDVIYASFYKNNSVYVGAYIGDEHLLRQRVFKQSDRVSDENNISEDTKQKERKSSEEFENILYERLFLKENWNTQGSLQNYMYALIQRIHYLYKGSEDITEYVIFNNNKTQAIINSGLIDRFGNDILVLYSFDSDTGIFTEPEIVSNKNLMVRNDFTVKELKRNIEVVPFYNDISEIIFNADFDDFDFSNMERINHCIIERKGRLPEKYRGLQDDILCQKLINSVQTAVKLSKRDISYVKPMYNIGRNKIQFLIPFCLENTVQSQPDLLIITDKDECGFWNVMTLLKTEDAYYNAKLFSKYTSLWNI